LIGLLNFYFDRSDKISFSGCKILLNKVKTTTFNVYIPCLL